MLFSFPELDMKIAFTNKLVIRIIYSFFIKKEKIFSRIKIRNIKVRKGRLKERIILQKNN